MRKAIGPLLLLTLAGCAAGHLGPPPGFGPAGALGGPPGGRPPRAGVFLSPMGEPFRAQEPGVDLIGRWFAGADADRSDALSVTEMQADAARFFRLLDLNGDGEIDPAEMTRYETEIAPEIRFAQRMAGGGPGGIGGGRPEGRGPGGPPGGGMGGMGPGGGMGGMGRGGGMRPGGSPLGGGPGRRGPGSPGGGLGLLDIPQPVASADADFNRGVTLAEFERAAGQRFLLLDRNHDGTIAREELARPGRPGQRR